MTSVAIRPTARPSAPPALWILACALAEAIGMTASAAAARGADGLDGVTALGLVVAGGLVEGTALGVLQAAWLTRRFPGISRPGWALVTILIAGVGWSLASAPSALGGVDGEAPPAALILVGAAGLGAVMGAVIGAAQALVLRGHVRHPWRWISISAAAWTPAMVVIFAGATLPDASWSIPVVVALGAVTGLLAGAALGGVSLALLATLDGQSVWSGILARLLLRNRFGLGRALVLLRITGIVTGRSFEFPVQYARDADTVVVLPGGAEHETWWRNLEAPGPLSIWIDGGWRPAEGRVIRLDDGAEFQTARALYARRFPALHVRDDAVLVRIRLRTASAGGRG